MKTTKRSKMLLSSIAMLLVALVALGSATYAWYVVNKEVYASPTTLSAAAAEGLVINNTNSGDIKEWGNSITLTATDSGLDPISLNLSESNLTISSLTGVKAKGTDMSNGAWTSNTASSVAATDYVTESFYVAYTGTGSKEVFIKNTAAAAAGSYEVAAIFAGSTEAYKGAFNSDGSDTTADRVNNGASVTLTDANTAGFSIGNVGSTPVKVTVVAFVDGENDNCKNSTANTSNYSFNFTAYYS